VQLATGGAQRVGHSCVRGVAALIALAFTLSSCAGTEATPTFPPPTGRVAVSAALEPFAGERLRAYAKTSGVPAFDLEVWSMADAIRAAEDGRIDMLVSGEVPPDGWFATPLGFEGIAIALNPGVDVHDLNVQQLRDIFSGLIQSWDELDGPALPVQLVIPPRGDDLRMAFERLVLTTGRVSKTAIVAPSPSATVSLLGELPGSIGLLPMSSVPEGTHLVRIEGQSASASSLNDGRYPLRFEVIATAPDEPPTVIRDWLVWIQAQDGSGVEGSG